MECTQVDGACAFELKLRVLVRVSATFQVDPFWPKALPNNWLLGHVIGVAVDSRDHIWVLHRPRSLSDSKRGAESTSRPQSAAWRLRRCSRSTKRATSSRAGAAPRWNVSNGEGEWPLWNPDGGHELF